MFVKDANQVTILKVMDNVLKIVVKISIATNKDVCHVLQNVKLVNLMITVLPVKMVNISLKKKISVMKKVELNLKVISLMNLFNSYKNVK